MGYILSSLIDAEHLDKSAGPISGPSLRNIFKAFTQNALQNSNSRKVTKREAIKRDINGLTNPSRSVEDKNSENNNIILTSKQREQIIVEKRKEMESKVTTICSNFYRKKLWSQT